MKESYSTSEVAKYCHVTADTIRKWAEAGRIHVFKTPGGHRRIRREDLIRFLRDNNIPIHGELSSAGTRILVIESEPTVVSVIQRFLERSQGNFQVEIARDALDAGRQVATFRPDVVFLDLRLPGVDGLDVCRRLRELPELTNTRLITMTPPVDGDLGSRSIEMGAALTLNKPFTPDDLRRALAKVGIEIN